jgi:RNA-directed DNA polymerase
LVVHCVSEREAQEVLAALTDRMEEVGLRLHPDKTKIVYCKDGGRRGLYEHTEFTFLGYTFRTRKAQDKNGRRFASFLPAISKDAQNKISAEIRGWHLHRRSDLSFGELAKRINPMVAGWMNYYGRFYRSAMSPLLMRINAYLVRWIRQKYKRLVALRKAIAKMQEIAKRYPRIFAHWKWTVTASSAW